MIQNYSDIPYNLAPIWPMDSAIDISIYVSPSLVMPALSSMPSESLVAEERNFKIGDYKDKRTIETTIAIPREVQGNGTLWAHFYVALAGHQDSAQDDPGGDSGLWREVGPWQSRGLE